MTTNYRKPYTTEVSKGELVEGHESYGLLQISRTQGGGRHLFGSHIENQHQFITIEIKQAEVIHSLARDWYYARVPLIEIHMTAAQFAEAITSLNMSSGVPCTIHRVLGDSLEPVPQMTETESKKIRTSFRQDVKDLTVKLLEGSKKVNELLEKKSLTVSDKESIRNVFGKAIQDVKDNLPFIVESFQESTEKVVTQAKAEVDAFVSMGLQKLGLQAVEKRLASGEEPSLMALSAGDDDE